MKKINKIIGIDPDLKKSGITIYDIEKKEYEICTSLPMWDLFSILKLEKNSFVILEFSTSNFTWQKGGKVGAMNVGKNKAVATIIKEYLDFLQIPYKLAEPAGYSNYFKDVDFFEEKTGIAYKTNQDARASAAMIELNKNKIDYYQKLAEKYK